MKTERPFQLIEQFLQDLRYGLRVLRKNPGFTSIIVLTLGLGIGANTAIFTLLDYVVTRSLPVRNARELVLVAEPDQFSYPAYRRLRELNSCCSEIVGVSTLPEMLFGLSGQVEGLAKGSLVSGNYFSALGVGPLLGRTIQPADDSGDESSPVAVISYDFWQHAFNGSPDVLGRTLRVRSNPGYAATSGLDIYDGGAVRSRKGAVLTIVGVTPPGFFGHVVGASTQVWIPMAMQPAVMPGRPWLDKPNVRWVNLIGRLKPNVNPSQAGAALTTLWRQLLSDDAGAELTPEQKRSIAQEVLKVESGGKGFGWVRLRFAQSLQVLMAAAALVLLIACLNVGNLLFTRHSARQRELAVHLALGSGRFRLIRQLLTESLLLGALGGLLGLLLAYAGTRILLAMASSGYQAIDLHLSPDFRILGFTAAVSLIATVLFGLAPALRSTSVRLGETLKDAARGMSSRRRSAAAKSLVAIQVGTSMVLLIGGGLLVRTLHNLRTQDVGYNPDHLMMLRLDPVSAGYHGDDIGRVCKNILDRIAALPGVRAATFSENGLFYGPESQTRIEVEDFTPGSIAAQRARFDQVGPGYFTSLGVPLLLGRDFTERDGPNDPRVVVINETLARFYFPAGNPIGKHIVTRVAGHRLQAEVIGVARNVQDHSFWSEPVRRFYVSYFQPIDGITEANFAIRTIGNPGNMATTLRHEVEAVDPGLMLLGIENLTNLMNRSLEQTRLLTHVSAFFAVLAAGLAAIGLYGVMSYDVVQRTNEIGIRMALGARRRDVVGLFLTGGLRLIAVGLALGTGVAIAIAGLLRAYLFGVEPTDPGTFVGVAIFLAAVALLACFIPAHRATKVDPMTALRVE